MKPKTYWLECAKGERWRSRVDRVPLEHAMVKAMVTRPARPKCPTCGEDYKMILNYRDG